MYKIGDYLVYRKNVCKVINVNENRENKYYAMKPIDDNSLIINLPINNTNNIRNLISLKDANRLIDSIPDIKLIDDFNEKNLENIYKDLLNNGSHSELIQIIKTAYTRNDHRIKNRKKISDKDDKYFKLAEKYLYNELSIVLNISIEETKNYIIERVTKLSK